MKNYPKTVWLAFDKLVNAIFKGRNNETISVRWGRAVRKDRCVLCKLFCWLLDFYDPNHCEDAVARKDGP